MKVPRKLKRISRLEPKSLAERGLKLCEENGELAAEIFKLLGKKKTNQTKKETLEHLREEAVDCLIMALDILVKVKTSDKTINRILNAKLDKWLDKMEKRR